MLVAFASGLTAFLLNQIPESGNGKEYLNQPPILEKIAIPGLSDIPLVGEALFNQTVLVYLMYVVDRRSSPSCSTRPGGACGCARSASTRRPPTPSASGSTGCAGRRCWPAAASPASAAPTSPSARRAPSTRTSPTAQGFIALAAVIMGRWHPVGATLAALFFGFMWNLQNQVGLVGKVPSELLGAAPYLATIIAVAGFVGRVRPPAADGEPYVKG